MNVRASLDERLDSTRIEREVDEVCDRFEAAWRAGGRPLIEDFLSETTDSDRPVLLRYLLGLELDYRHMLAESPGPSEYRLRFAEHERLIDSVFAEFAQRHNVFRDGDSVTLLQTDGEDRSSGTARKQTSEILPSIPGFEIRSELGRGGMGIVYKARQIGLNRICALKMLLLDEHTGAESRARFLAEAETIAKLKHPSDCHDQTWTFGRGNCPAPTMSVANIIDVKFTNSDQLIRGVGGNHHQLA